MPISGKKGWNLGLEITEDVCIISKMGDWNILEGGNKEKMGYWNLWIEIK
jgi:hypothetical protein